MSFAPSPKLQQIMSCPIGYDMDRKAAFHHEARRLLRRLAKALALDADSYDIRSNQGGIAVSGEVTLHGETLYVQVSQSYIGPGSEVLYRQCNGRKDYCGDRNHFASASDLSEPEQLAATISKNLFPTI